MLDSIKLQASANVLHKAMVSNDRAGVAEAVAIFPGIVNYMSDDDNRCTALWYSARLGHIAVCLELLRHGADVDLGHREQGSPLMIGVRRGHLYVCTLLLRHGANVDYVDKDRNTPLLLALQYGNVEILKVLIEYGANVNSLTKKGISPLMLAASFQDFD